MLQVTSQAIDRLSTLLTQYQQQDDQVIRLVMDSDSQFAISLSSHQSGDQVINDGDKAILVLDQGTSGLLDGMVLDADEGGGLRVAPVQQEKSQSK